MFVDEVCSIVDSLIREVKKSIILWGCGNNANALLQYSDVLCSDPIFVDKNRDGEKYYGRIILSPDEIDYSCVEMVIITPIKESEIIKKELRERYKYDGKVLSITEITNNPLNRMVSKRDVLPSNAVAKILDRNKIFKNIHNGERVFILCTGPSIRKTNLKWLKNEYTIAVSSFCLHSDCKYINPTYYCIPSFEETYSELRATERLRRVVSKGGSDTKYFYSIHEKRIVDEMKEYLYKEVYYLDFVYFPSFESIDLDICNRIPSPQSVSIMALTLALYMGFKEIVLLGTEHDSLRTGEYEHFYEKEESLDSFQNYDELGKYKNSFSSDLADYGRLWEQYKQIKIIAERNGSRIVNATQGGVLDVFERVQFEKLLGEGPRRR